MQMYSSLESEMGRGGAHGRTDGRKPDGRANYCIQVGCGGGGLYLFSSLVP
jgi:hypothetical protein